MPDLRPAARLHTTIQALPDMLPRVGAQGHAARRHQGELVDSAQRRFIRATPAYYVADKRVMIMMTDPVADMLTRIRNAVQVGHSSVVIPSSKLKLSLARILRDEGFVQNYDVIPAARSGGSVRPPQIRIWLRYMGERRDRKSVISGLRRVSKPGRRVYVGKTEIPWVLSGTGIAVLSTPKGVLTDRQARKMGVGGEVMCYVW
jgi:small subunit ribosomal protein S8